MNTISSNRNISAVVTAKGRDNSHAPGSGNEPQTEMGNIELRDWLESYDYVVQTHGPEWAAELLHILRQRPQTQDVPVMLSLNTPFINTIPVDKQPQYPGNRELERRIKSLIRWNALAMVVRANRRDDAIGGHISTYASAQRYTR